MKELTLCLPTGERDYIAKQVERITTRRNRQVNHYLHAASKAIIDWLVKEKVGTIIIRSIWKEYSMTY